MPAGQASDLQGRVRARLSGVRRHGLLQASLKVAGPTAPGRASRPWLGILYMGIACALFPIMNALVKLLATHYHFEEVVWARVLSHLVFIVLLFMPRRGFALFHTRQPGLQFVCSMTLLASPFFFFGAVKYVT